MRPFDPPGQGTSGLQQEFDTRRVDFLERLAKRAILKSDAFNAWNAAERVRHPTRHPDDANRIVSPLDAGYATICDAVDDLGLEALDPGLNEIRERLRHMSLGEQAAQQRAWLDDDNRVTALARVVLARANPDRADELLGWTRAGVDPQAWWADKERLSSVHMEYLLDTADFGANELLRTLYLLADTPDHLKDAAPLWRDADSMGRDPNMPADGAEHLRQAFTTFKYWFDDPFRCSEFQGRAKEIREQADDAAKIINHHEKMDPDADMTYWSENHRLLFATAEYLAGQYWPDDLFVSARRHRKDGPLAPPREGDIPGAEHRERARRRIIRWLNERLRLGFAEWNAPGYYVEDALPLLNLVDFAVDPEVRTRAAMVLDIVLFDLAVNRAGGAFAGSAGRAYFENKNCMWEQSIGDMAELLFGDRGHYTEMSNAAIFLATSPGYDPPDVLLEIVRRPPAALTNRSRVSINFDEAAEHGVGFSTKDDMEFWWSRAGYATKQTILGSHRVAKENGLLKTPPFKDIIPMIEKAAAVIDAAEDVGAGILGGIAGAAAGFAVGGPAGAIAGAATGAAIGASEPNFTEADAADLASVLTEGSVLTRANLYARRNAGAILASVQDFRPGQLNFQGLPCIAALSNGAMVWTTYPSAGTHLELGIGSTTWALLGAFAGGPIGLAVGALAMPDVEIVNEDLFKPNDHNGPNWWTGNAVQPRVVQREGAAIIAYQAKEIQKLMFGERTHAWFPKDQFDEVRGPETARCNHDSARWFFGRAGDSYVALFSAREATWTDGGPWKDREIRAEGDTNVFVIQIGGPPQFNSFEAFVAAVGRARVHVSGLHNPLSQLECSYDVPRGERFELHYEDGPRYGGEPFSDDEFPRTHNPFARIAWQQDRYAIQHGRKSLIHDIPAGRRILGGRLGELAHDTPLTFYAQNMGLLPWPLYKGVDADRALGHLIAVLRERRPDVVGLSEMWSADDRERARAELRDIYPFALDGPHDPVLETPLGDVEFMTGGLLILSRHRITAANETVFRQCSGDDCLAAKGVLHTRIQPRGHPTAVDTFLTHTQAAHPTVGGTTEGALVAVEAQIRHLAAFIRACREDTAPALLFGDFNVDAFTHPDIYAYLVAELGEPVDLAPAVVEQGVRCPTATSESDEGEISSFHPGHPSRAADDHARFGDDAERLDYLFAFPGLRYAQHPASSRVVVEQWTPGRDMSDHYGIEGTIDTTLEQFPPNREVATVQVRLVAVRCLQTSAGPGDDEVRLHLALRPGTGQQVTQSTREIEHVEAGSRHELGMAMLRIGDPGDQLEVVVQGSEVDSLSADDDLGRVAKTLERDELIALGAQGSTSTPFSLPVLNGGGGVYVVDCEIEVELH
jgi:hypothetical protein